MSDPLPQRVRLTGPAEAREAALDRLHVWTEVLAVLEDDVCDVVSCSGVLPDLASELWIVTHQDLKNTARIRAFLSVIGDAIVAARRSFEGQT